MRRSTHTLPFLALLLLTALLPAAHMARAAGERCFPETGQCLSGRFLQYWEQNGGLPVFGFPIAPAHDEVNRDTGQTYLTQWLERNRFELHPENAAPYDVLLGRLGDDRLRQQGIDWQTQPREDGPRPGCLWFAQTGHNVCDQRAGLGFKTYWQKNGLLDTRLDGFGRSLALFGLPLTTPRMEINSSGDSVLTQSFERARFEWHPNEPDQYKVLLGLLGNEVHSGPRQIASTIIYSNVIAADHYLFWYDIRSQYKISADQNHAIYGYDVNTQTEFIVRDTLTEKHGLASDATTIAWLEDYAAGSQVHERIQGYNLASRTEFTILEISDLNVLGGFALDHGVLYYSDSTPEHRGVYARTLATGQERRVLPTPVGYDFIVADGVMLWSEVLYSGPPGPGDGRLHMLKLDGSLDDTVIARVQNAFSSYDVSGDSVVWSTYGDWAYLYSISTGTSKIISPGLASYPSIDGRIVSWIDWPDNRPGQPARWLIQLYNLDTGDILTLDEEPGLEHPFIAVIGQNSVAYTVHHGNPVGTLYLRALKPLSR